MFTFRGNFAHHCNTRNKNKCKFNLKLFSALLPEHNMGIIDFSTVVVQLPGLQIYLYSNQEKNIISGTALNSCTTNDINDFNDLVVQLKNYFLLSLSVD